MSYRFIDFPIPVDLDFYEKAINSMLGKMATWPCVKAIYQIGGISTPGISDLDMVVVFDDNASFPYNPRQSLSRSHRYLFPHSLFGTSLTHFLAAQNYSYFHNYKLLWGSDVVVSQTKKNKTDEQILKAQIALEYLMRMYISLVIQRAYKVYKVREILLHIKAVRYDLDLLEISSGHLVDITNKFIELRNRWFETRPAHKTLTDLLDAFYQSLVDFLSRVMNQHHFYLPQQDRHAVGRVIEAKPGERTKYLRNGILLPNIFSVIGRRYFNLLNRLNSFVFEFPFTTLNTPPILAERFAHIKDMKEYNFQRLPHFDPLTTSLNIL